MSRDSGSEQPGQRTVAELLAQHGGSGSSERGGTRRRRRRAEDPTETAPHAIIDRVMSDSGQMRAVGADGKPLPPSTHRPQQPSDSPQQPKEPQASAPAVPDAPAPPAAPPPAPSAPPTSFAPPQGPAPTHGPAPTNAAPSPPVPPAPPADGAGEPAPAEPPPARKNANFWAEKFAAARGSKRGRAPEAQAPAKNDVESTVQQPALPRRPQPFPNSREMPAPSAMPPEGQPQEARPPEGQTEQFPPVTGAAQALPPRQDAGPAPVDEASTAMLPYADQEVGDGASPVDSTQYGADSYGSGGYAADPYADPYDFDSYDGEEQREPEELAAQDSRSERDRSGQDSSHSYDHEAPAGLPRSEYEADESEFDESEESSAREWAVFIAQGVAALVAGGAVWFGFRWLWSEISLAALVAAVAVTGVLVLVSRRFVRNDDVQTMLLAVLVGLVCTVSPAALLLIGQ